MTTTATPTTDPICWYCKQNRATTETHLRVDGNEVVVPLCPQCVRVACIAMISVSPAADAEGSER